MNQAAIVTLTCLLLFCFKSARGQTCTMRQIIGVTGNDNDYDLSPQLGSDQASCETSCLNDASCASTEYRSSACYLSSQIVGTSGNPGSIVSFKSCVTETPSPSAMMESSSMIEGAATSSIVVSEDVSSSLAFSLESSVEMSSLYSQTDLSSCISAEMSATVEMSSSFSETDLSSYISAEMSATLETSSPFSETDLSSYFSSEIFVPVGMSSLFSDINSLSQSSAVSSIPLEMSQSLSETVPSSHYLSDEMSSTVLTSLSSFQESLSPPGETSSQVISPSLLSEEISPTILIFLSSIAESQLSTEITSSAVDNSSSTMAEVNSSYAIEATSSTPLDTALVDISAVTVLATSIVSVTAANNGSSEEQSDSNGDSNPSPLVIGLSVVGAFLCTLLIVLLALVVIIMKRRNAKLSSMSSLTSRNKVPSSKPTSSMNGRNYNDIDSNYYHNFYAGHIPVPDYDLNGVYKMKFDNSYFIPPPSSSSLYSIPRPHFD